jgi:hypothetical protein
MQSEVMSAKPLFILFSISGFQPKVPSTTSLPARNPPNLINGSVGVMIIN